MIGNPRIIVVTGAAFPPANARIYAGISLRGKHNLAAGQKMKHNIAEISGRETEAKALSYKG